MKIWTSFCGVLHLALVTSFSISQRGFHPSKRQDRLSENQLGCVQMESREGEFYFDSPGIDAVCGLYVIAKPDELVQVTFSEFHVSCEDGLVAVVDGWEAQGQFFPSEFDTSVVMEERYKTYCGDSLPSGTFISSQNVALIQFRIPTPGQGFAVAINFIKNMQPCNVVSMVEEGYVTIQNYGHRGNCSVSIMYPEKIDVVSVDVAHSSRFPLLSSASSAFLNKIKYSSQCEPHAEDYVEILDGNGLDPSYMWQEATLCGIDPNPRKKKFYLGCQHSVVRLVSSGKYYNSVTFRHRQLNDREQQLLSNMPC